MESRKMVPNNLQGSNGETEREQTHGHREKAGEGEMYGRVTWKLTLPYVK